MHSFVFVVDDDLMIMSFVLRLKSSIANAIDGSSVFSGSQTKEREGGRGGRS